MNFASDNAAGVAPAVLDAILRANSGFALGYGNDDLTRAVERRLAELFERDVAVFLVPTGTAANALALAHLTTPWGGVLCHAEAHIATDECGAQRIAVTHEYRTGAIRDEQSFRSNRRLNCSARRPVTASFP